MSTLIHIVLCAELMSLYGTGKLLGYSPYSLGTCLYHDQGSNEGVDTFRKLILLLS